MTILMTTKICSCAYYFSLRILTFLSGYSIQYRRFVFKRYAYWVQLAVARDEIERKCYGIHVKLKLLSPVFKMLT